MAYEFQKLSEVEILTEVPEGASVLAEINGDIKRLPSDGLGGSGIKTAIIKSSDYDDTIAALLEGGASASAAPPTTTTYSCINMTFEEAYQTMASGEPLNIVGMINDNGCLVLNGFSIFIGNAIGVPCIIIGLINNTINVNIQLFWTAEGFSIDPPSGGK